MRHSRTVLLGLAAAGLILSGGSQTTSSQSAPAEKIAVKVLYAGHPGSAREKEFLTFLRKYFTEVQTGDLAKFTGSSADAFDVAILDYDGDGFRAPRPSLSPDYARATVAVGVAGAMIGSRLRLKTGYE
jgi:hypothetical protein